MVVTRRQQANNEAEAKAAAAPGATATAPPAAKPHYEFGGPVGVAVLMLVLPGVVYLLYFLCPGSGAGGGSPDQPPGSLPYCATASTLLDRASWSKLGDNVAAMQLFSWEAVLVVLGWLSFQLGLDRALPGRVVPGAKLRSGARLEYKLNGHLAFWVSLSVMCHGCPRFDGDGQFVGFGPFELEWCYRNFTQLATASVLVSTALSVYLYARSFNPGALLAEGGDTGNPVYDFFIGRELNPRFGGSNFDLKEHCELKPGLIGWVVINIGMALEQRARTGSISGSMLAVNLCQGLYVWDALYHESAVLTTMDITTDGFGFMLAFGDLCWVPFTYTLQVCFS